MFRFPCFCIQKKEKKMKFSQIEKRIVSLNKMKFYKIQIECLRIPVIFDDTNFN